MMEDAHKWFANEVDDVGAVSVSADKYQIVFGINDAVRLDGNVVRSLAVEFRLDGDTQEALIVCSRKTMANVETNDMIFVRELEDVSVVDVLQWLHRSAHADTELRRAMSGD